MTYTIKDLVSDGKLANFYYYKDNNLWYSISMKEEEFTFPVPIDDIGNATFWHEDKAILFMRYIRKHLTTIEAARMLNDETVTVVEFRTAWEIEQERLAKKVG